PAGCSRVPTSSCSACPRSIPMCHAQLNSTAFRSRAPGSGVYSAGPLPNPCAPVGGTFIVVAATTARADVATNRGKDITTPRAAAGFVDCLVDTEIELAVSELEASDESRGVAVPGGEDRDLEELARFDRIPVDPGPAQHVGRRGGQDPLGRRAVPVRYRELEVRVRIAEVQLRELAL